MTGYTLKSTVLAPVSTVIDLSSHRSGAWITQPRLRDGKWTRTGGGLSGKHAEYKDPDRKIADAFKGVTTDVTSFSTIDWDGLMHTAADPNAEPAEREAAVRKVNLHLEQLKRVVQTTTATTQTTRTTTHTAGVLKMGPKIAPVAKPVETYAKDTAADVRNVALAQHVLDYAVRAAGAASALIGVHEADHLTESFRKIAENPAMESGASVAIAFLLTMLIAKIQKAFRDRHDRKIAKARGEI